MLFPPQPCFPVPLMQRWIEEHAPDATALSGPGGTLTYAALRDRIAAAAAALAAQGLGRGDRLAFLGQNHPAQLVLLFACARLGAMLVPLNWRLATPELRFILEDSGARLLAATREMTDAARAAVPPGCALLDAEAGWPAAPAPPMAGGPDDPVLLVYTSGTTGRPKGAVLDQRAILANAANARHAFGLTAADRVLTL